MDPMQTYYNSAYSLPSQPIQVETTYGTEDQPLQTVPGPSWKDVVDLWDGEVDLWPILHLGEAMECLDDVYRFSRHDNVFNDVSVTDAYAEPWDPLGGRQHDHLLDMSMQSAYHDTCTQAPSSETSGQQDFSVTDWSYGTHSIVDTGSEFSSLSKRGYAHTDPAVDFTANATGRSAKRAKTTHTASQATQPRSLSSRARSKAKQLPACQVCQSKGTTFIPVNAAAEKKHRLQHLRPFACNIGDCIKKPCFPNTNDLERHQLGCHGIQPKHGIHRFYKCTVPHCPKSTKIWPRKDNYKQHIQRMHRNISDDSTPSVGYYVEQSVYQPTEDELQALQTSKSASAKTLSTQAMSTTESIADTSMSYAAQYERLDDSMGWYDALVNAADVEAVFNHPDSAHDRVDTVTAPSDWVQDPAFTGLDLMSLEDLGQLYDAKDMISNLYGYGLGQLDGDIHEPFNVADDHSTEFEDLGTCQGLGLDVGMGEGLMVEQSDSFATVIGLCDEQALSSQHKCPECPTVKRRLCDLRKHSRRHTRPFGCTFPKCERRSGSKNDWRRHESSQHTLYEKWRCTKGACVSAQPANVYYNVQQFRRHLFAIHGIAEDSQQADIEADLAHIGAGNVQDRMWCGFCGNGRGAMVGLSEVEIDATTGSRDLRLEHIGSHFDQGQSTLDWVCVDMNKPKRYLWETGISDVRGLARLKRCYLPSRYTHSI